MTELLFWLASRWVFVAAGAVILGWGFVGLRWCWRAVFGKPEAGA